MPYAVVIIAADHLESARALAEGEFGLPADVAAQEFVPAGSLTGSLPATHYWLATSFTDESFAKLKQLEAVVGWAKAVAYDLDTEPLRPWDVLAEMGMQPLNHDVP
jgi:hypothetical protein